MIRRTFFSTALASVAALFGVRKAEATLNGRTPKNVQVFFDRSWLSAPDRVGQWWWKAEADSFPIIVSVFKKDGELYCLKWDRQELQLVSRLASEMGGDWRYYGK